MKPAAFPDNNDELLCYCEGAGPHGQGIGAAEWRRAVQEHSNLDFYQLCDHLSVGRRCTACLLDAEALFDQAARTREAAVAQISEAVADPGSTVAHTTVNSLTCRQKIYQRLDAALPARPATYTLCIPVVRGRQMKTSLALSNCYPSSIGDQSSQYKYRVTTRDANGRKRRTRDIIVQTGRRADIDVSDDLDTPGDKVFSTGSCWIEMTPTGRGLSGSTRPHFRLIGTGGVSAVHAQSKSPRKSSQVFSQRNDREHHLIHVINTDSRPNDFSVRTRALDESDGGKTSGTLPPFGSALIELPRVEDADLFLSEIECQGHWRCHYMIADFDFSRMSADHA